MQAFSGGAQPCPHSRVVHTVAFLGESMQACSGGGSRPGERGGLGAGLEGGSAIGLQPAGFDFGGCLFVPRRARPVYTLLDALNAAAAWGLRGVVGGWTVVRAWEVEAVIGSLELHTVHCMH
eukprot:COSAG02_NODE_973_length_15536_cov_5.108635_15_plen_122_part_00